MSENLDDINAKLKLDLKDFEKNLKKAEGRAKQSSNKMSKAFLSLDRGIQKMNKSLTGFKVLIAGVAGVLSAKLVTSQLKFIDRLDKTAMKLGVTTEFLQKYGFVAESLGIPQERLNVALQRFGRRVGDTSMEGQILAQAFKSLKIEMYNAEGGVRSLDNILPEFLNKLGKIKSANQANSIAMKAFDMEGVELVNIAKLGSAGIKKLIERFKQLGGAMSNDAIKKAAEANKKLNQLTFMLKNKFAEAMADAAPAIEKFATQLLKDLPHLISLFKGFAKGMAWVAKTAAEFRVQIDKAGAALNEKIFGIDPQRLKNIQDAKKELTDLKKQAAELNSDPMKKFFDLLPGGSMGLKEVEKNIAAVQQRLAELQTQTEQNAGTGLLGALQGSQNVSTGNTGSLGKEKDDTKDAGIDLDTDKDEALQKEAERANARMELMSKQLTNMRDGLKSEGDLLEEKLQRELDLLQEFRESELLSEEEYQNMKSEIIGRGEERMTALTKKGEEDRTKWARLGAAQRAQMILGALAQLTAASSNQSKKDFERNKKVSIAGAIVNTWMAVSEALKLPVPVNFVMAAINLAAGIKTVQNIRKQSYNGGGGTSGSIAAGGGGGGGGGSIPGMAKGANSPTSDDMGKKDKKQKHEVNIKVTGKLFDDQAVIEVIEGINEKINDDVELSASKTVGE